jgi:hypothetical protein
MDIRSSHCVSMTEMGDELAKIIAEGSASLEHVFRKEVILVDGKAMTTTLHRPWRLTATSRRL